MDSSRAVFGIDLGTTYSCIAMIDDYDQAVVIRNLEGSTTTPSVVYFEDRDKVLVGTEAKEMLMISPEKTVEMVKRKIGNDIYFDKETNILPYGYDPVMISSMILRKIVYEAKDETGLDVKDVVITCPAYFGTKERQQTRQAGEIAGLNVLSIISEPTAAAINYGVKSEGKKTIAVYDLGGGTFDVTIISVNGGAVKVIATGGSHMLGGHDWDEKLALYLLKIFNEENHTHHTIEDDLFTTLLVESERWKKRLSAKESVTCNIWDSEHESRIPVTRAIFDSLTEGLLDETISYMRDVMEIAAEKGYDRIDEIVLVGGSSRMPQVKGRIEREFGISVRLNDPDECVAKGAAIYAFNLLYNQKVRDYEKGTLEKCPPPLRGDRTRVVNVTSKSYGIGVLNEEMVHVLYANTPLPVRIKDDTFFTAYEGQTAIQIEVFESDFTSPTDRKVKRMYCTLLEKHILQFDRAYPARTPLQIIFDVDEEGILHISADVERNHLEFDLKIKGVRSSQEVSKARDIITKTRIE